MVPLGPGPCARFGHSSTLVGGQLLLAGGCDDDSNMKPGEGGREFDDIWLLDLRLPRGAVAFTRPAPPLSSPLSSPPSPPPSPPRGALQRCHAAVAFGGPLVLFFGGGRSRALTNGLAVFDTATGRWSSPARVSGAVPRRRQNAMVGLLSLRRDGGGETGRDGGGGRDRSVLVVFGGWAGCDLGDTRLLDVDAWGRGGGAGGSGGSGGSAAEVLSRHLLSMPQRWWWLAFVALAVVWLRATQ